MKNVFLYGLFILFPVGIFSQGVWTQKASFPGAARGDAFTFSINNKGYLGAGSDNISSWFSDVWEYDGQNNSWTQKQNFSGTRWHPVYFNIGLKGYMGTGQDAASLQYNDFWEYDPVSDTWTQKASLPTVVRDFASGFSIGTKGYICMGLNGTSVLFDDLWEYDVTGNSWVQKANFPGGKRLSTVGFAVGSKGYVGFGKDNTNTFYNDLWEYDPSADLWTQKSSCPGAAREEVDGARFIIGNGGYLGTGRAIVSSAWVYYNDFWKYNSTNDTWAQIPNLPAVARIGASNFSLNGKGYIGLGFVLLPSMYSLNDLWEYMDTTIVGIDRIAENQNNIILYQNEPNPFGNSTSIRYFIPEESNLSETFIVFYDEFGKEVKKVQVINTGFGRIEAETSNLASGIYSYSIVVGSKVVDTKKMLRIK